MISASISGGCWASERAPSNGSPPIGLTGRITHSGSATPAQQLHRWDPIHILTALIRAPRVGANRGARRIRHRECRDGGSARMMAGLGFAALATSSGASAGLLRRGARNCSGNAASRASATSDGGPLRSGLVALSWRRPGARRAARPSACAAAARRRSHPSWRAGGVGARQFSVPARPRSSFHAVRSKAKSYSANFVKCGYLRPDGNEQSSRIIQTHRVCPI
jgi:hypothetical protein